MELNKRKSLLTPAAPTVWGMIHGDIGKQEDLLAKLTEIYEVLNQEFDLELGQKQDTLQSGVNIKTVKGRSILGDGDLDPLDSNDRRMLNTISDKADKATTYTKTEVNTLLANVKPDDSKLATKMELQELQVRVDEQIGGINTMTEDILG